MHRFRGLLAGALSVSVVLLLCCTAVFAAIHAGDDIFVVAVVLSLGGLALLAPWRVPRYSRPATVRRRRVRVRTAVQLEARLRGSADPKESVSYLAPGPTT